MLPLNPTPVWKFVKELNRRKTISSTVMNNIASDSQTDSPQLFSNYYSSVFIPPLPFLSIPTTYNSYPYNLSSNYLFSIDDVQSVLTSLKIDFSNGLDDISARQLSNCCLSIVYPQFLLFKRSIDKGIFPDVWKICFITPVLKSSDLSIVFNYRSIFILSHIDKLFEYLVYKSVKRCIIICVVSADETI